MSELLLDGKIVAIAAALEAASISHAFGGAIALAYYGTPRGTTDIDLNVFLDTDEAYALIKVFKTLGIKKPDQQALDTLAEKGRLSVHWDHTPIDLFFAYDDFHFSCQKRIRRVPFSGTDIPILSPEDLIVFKVIYGRPKDFRDIREILLCMGQDLNPAYISSWLDRFIEGADRRMVNYREALEERRLGEATHK